MVSLSSCFFAAVLLLCAIYFSKITWEGLVLLSQSKYCFFIIMVEGERLERQTAKAPRKIAHLWWNFRIFSFKFEQNPKFKNLRENTFFFKPFTQHTY